MLFIDIVGFTELSRKISSPFKIASILQKLYSDIDEVCFRNNLFKVHTIGDCYVLLGFNWSQPIAQRDGY